MPRRPSTAQAAARPHARAKADKRVGQAATSGDPWAERIRAAIFEAYHPWQKQAANDPSRFWTVLTGRGAGKTTLFKGRYLTEMAATPKGKYIYACPTLGMAVELLWEPLKETCSQLGLEFGKDVHFFEAPREGGKIMVLDRTGSRLKLFGADDQKQINLCRGQPFDGVGGDEMVYWNIDLVDNFVRKVIGPRIGERNGWIGLASSPGHVLRGFFYDRPRDGSTVHPPSDKRDEPASASATDGSGWRARRVTCCVASSTTARATARRSTVRTTSATSPNTKTGRDGPRIAGTSPTSWRYRPPRSTTPRYVRCAGRTSR